MAKTKKIAYFYYIFLLALWPLVDHLLGVGTRISPWFLLLLPLYVAWLLCSQFFLYWLKRKKPLKSAFNLKAKCVLEWSTFWLDREHGELAALFLFYPFRVQYIPVSRVDDVRVKPEGLTEDEKRAKCISFQIWVDGRKYTMMAYSPGRTGMVQLDGPGGVFYKQVQAFADEILKAKRLGNAEDMRAETVRTNKELGSR